MATPQQEALRKKMQKGANNKIIRNHPQLRRSRLGIPQVNNNPRPPNEAKGPGQGTKQTFQNKGNGGKNTNKGASSGNQQNNNGGNNNQNQNTTPQLVPLQGQTDPRDAQYWQDLAVLTQNKNANLSSLDLEETYANTAYTDALSQMALDQPKQQRNIYEQRNKGGAFYSSVTGEDVGNLEQQYTRQRSNLARDFSFSSAQRGLQRSELESQGVLGSQQAYADALSRLAQQEMDAEAPNVNYNLNLGGQGKKKKKKK